MFEVPLLRPLQSRGSGVGDKDNAEVANIATKPSSRDDGFVAKLAISTNMLHKPDLSAARSGMIVCPRT